MSGECVLVTGGSGFIGVHCILQLLGAGYRVRTTVRSLERETDVRAMLKAGGVEPAGALSFAAADLMSDAGWPQAVAQCDFVLHVASPFPAGAPNHEDDLIVPAREGTLRVLRAARDAGVKRVVLTSSFAAIGYGSKPTDVAYSEENWTDLSGGNVSAYVKSKTLAERAAWDFIAREGGALELSVVNPVAVFGPVLGPDYSTSIQLLRRLMDGECRGTAPFLRHRRRAGRCGFAPARHDQPGRQGPAFPRRRGQVHEHQGNRPGAAREYGRCGEAGSDQSAAQLAAAHRRDA